VSGGGGGGGGAEKICEVRKKNGIAGVLPLLGGCVAVSG
jgi:hypothetical protein